MGTQIPEDNVIAPEVLDRVIAFIREHSKPEEPVVVPLIARELFVGDSQEAGKYVEVLIDKGELERVERDGVARIQLPPPMDDAEALTLQKQYQRAERVVQLRALFKERLGERAVGIRDSVLGKFVDAGLFDAQEICARIGRHQGIVPAALKEAGLPVSDVLQERLDELSAHDRPWLSVAAEAALLLSLKRKPPGQSRRRVALFQETKVLANGSTF